MSNRPALSLATKADAEMTMVGGEGLIRLQGATVQLDPSGALYWPSQDLLVVADLHLEKGSAAARRGRFLPPYDSRATLTALETVLLRLKPRRVLALGDSFHDRKAEERLAPPDHDRLAALTQAADWIWIKGNHDPKPPKSLAGITEEAVEIGPLLFRHAPSKARRAGEIAGHLHPCARVGLRGRSLRRRAFAFDGARFILPAFGAYAGGLNLLDPAYAGLLERARLIAWMIGAARIYPVRATALLPD